MKKFKFSAVTILTMVLILLHNKQAIAQNPGFISQIGKPGKWVDSVMKRLTLREKLGQIFMIRVFTDRDSLYQDSVKHVIINEHIGGIIYFHGSPVRQAELTNTLQDAARVPLLVAMDGEWGLGMRLDSVSPYPFQMTLGAIKDNRLIYKMGKAVANDFIRAGMQLNFAPDMDINNNPNNPVINYRSFGDDRVNVTLKGIAYMQGMQDAGLLTTAKHFPGHGDTEVDSHLNLPRLNFSETRLDSLEEVPFKAAIKAGVSGVLIAHLNIPALDSGKNIPSTLSRPIVTTLLKERMQFKGLVITDAMNMKGVVKYFPDGEADLKAFMAGNDILELSENTKVAADKIFAAIQSGLIPEADLDAKVSKILAAKYFTGLDHLKHVRVKNLTNDLNNANNRQLKQLLSDRSITLLKGKSIGKKVHQQKTLLIHIGTKSTTVFDHDMVNDCVVCTNVYLDNTSTENDVSLVLNTTKAFERVIVAVYDPRARPKSTLELNEQLRKLVSRLAEEPAVHIAVFANPYTIATLPGIEKAKSLLACYQMSDETQHAAAKFFNGTLKPSGRLPVTINAIFRSGFGL